MAGFAKQYFRLHLATWAVACSLMLMGCGSDKLIEELDLEIELTHFSSDKTDVYPGEEVHFVWEAEAIGQFDVRLFLSTDTAKSDDDFRFVNEDCGYDEDHCESDDRVIFTCLFLMDNSFDCDEDNKLISVNDITTYLEELPMYGYVIIEVCDDTHCDRRSLELNFF